MFTLLSIVTNLFVCNLTSNLLLPWVHLIQHTDTKFGIIYDYYETVSESIYVSC